MFCFWLQEAKFSQNIYGDNFPLRIKTQKERRKMEGWKFNIRNKTYMRTHKGALWFGESLPTLQ